MRFSVLLAMIASTFLTATTADAQQPVERLWPGDVPLAKGTTDQDIPTLTVYLADPARAVGTAVIVCPGGGYARLAIDHEGHQVARWLNDLGVTAFVLKYRHTARYGHPVPLTDAKRAMRLVRSRAAEWKFAPNRIGILGFSAGGHLASTLATKFDVGQADSSDPIEKVSSRPDFVVLGYPVITMQTELGHAGSRRNLLGENPSMDLVNQLSNELHVTSATPPTFLFHTTEDTGVPPENSIFFYMALRKAKVPAELHIYERGAHGVGLAPTDPILSTWPSRLADWLKVRGVLTR